MKSIAVTVNCFGWQRVVGYKNCLCPDGKRRRVNCGDPDTFFSAPASVRVSYKGKRYTVKGFVSSVETETDGEYTSEVVFHTMATSENLFVFGETAA